MKMSHTKGASIDNAILRAFRRAISEKKIPESQWRDFAAQIIREFTGFDTVDPDLLDWIACKSEHARPKPPKFLDHKLECPYCLTIRLRIPTDARPDTPIFCDDCGAYLGTWDELQTDFERQGGHHGVFCLNKGRIQRVE